MKSDMKDYGLVSIIMPTWQCAEYISDAVVSVFAQTYHNWEIIVQDDASTDSTRDVIYGLMKSHPEYASRIKYERNEKHTSAADTRNRALKRAAGRWIAFLDSDDVWLPDKLMRQLSFMVDNGYSFSYHDYSEIDETGKDLGVYVSGIKKVNRLKMLSCCWPGCLTVMYDSNVTGLIQIENIRNNNDTAIWLKAVRKAPCYLLPENLGRYRRRAVSITPKSVGKRMSKLYPLFKVSEGMNSLSASFMVGVNLVGFGIKKTFYTKRDK